MPQNLFDISYTDIQKKITPGATDGGVEFVIGPSGELTDSDCNEIVLRAQEKVLSSLEPKYRTLLAHIDGEILTKYSEPGQTQLPLSFSSTSNEKIYLNFPERCIGWNARNVTHESPIGFTVASGMVTFAQPLPQGTTVYAEYDHTGASGIRYLKHIVESLAAVEVSRRFAYFRSADGFNRFLDWEVSAEKDLNKLRYRDIGIPQLDDMRLVYDDTDQDFYQSLMRL